MLNTACYGLRWISKLWITRRDCKRYPGIVASDVGEAKMNHPKTMSVPEAGRRYFDLGKNASYDAAKRGDIPVIRIGRRLRVPIVALDRKLEQAGDATAAPASQERLP
jgi:hypothetical protein